MVTLPPILLLDLDGTLLAFSASADPCWRHCCATHAPALTGPSPEDLFQAIRRSADRFWADPERDARGRLDLRWARRQIADDAARSLGAQAPEVTRALADDYTRLREEHVELFPEALEALHSFRERGVRLGLVTNGSSEAQRLKINRFGLGPLFDAILIEGEHGAGKPDPGIFHAALVALGAEPADAWMVGDNLERDVAGAQRVGVRAIWCDHRAAGLPRETPVRPDRIVRSVAELL